MDEKKIKDLTGNREEKIAAKRPVSHGETKENVQRQTEKRPFVRFAQPAEQMKEQRSGHTSDAEGKSDGEQKPKNENGKHQGERNRRNDRRDRSGRKQRDGETSGNEASSAKEPGKEQKNEDRQNRQAREKRRPDKQKQNNRQPDKQADRQNAKNAEKTPEKPSGKQEKQDKQPRPEKDRQNANNNKKKNDRRNDRKHGDKNREKEAEPLSFGNAVPEAVLPTKERERAKPEVFTDEQLRADGLLFTLDEQPIEKPVKQEEETPVETEQFEVVGVRFRGTGKTYYFAPNGITFAEGDHVILETVRGMEYGDIVLSNRMVGGNEVIQPLKPVLRKASEADDAHYRENCAAEDRARPVFFEKVEKNKLEMQLVDVEYTFDNTKLCFYFTAEGRVDFRELVKDLAAVFRTRIELRQIGVRDEARMFGGLGVCGRPFCCKSFLADFVQVSIRMAKDQNLSLASSKISGSCGRLMCCLRYEQDTYERESAVLPKQNSMVDTPKGRAMVLESSFLTGKIKVSMNSDHSIRQFELSEVSPVAEPTAVSQPKAAPERAAEEAAADLPEA